MNVLLFWWTPGSNDEVLDACLLEIVTYQAVTIT